MHLLDLPDQQIQAGILIDTTETELARFIDLRESYLSESGHIVPWIDHEIELLQSRIDWLSSFKSDLS